MPDGLDDLLDNTDGTAPASGGSAGGALRRQLEEALAQNKALNDRLAAQEARQRDRDLAGLFEKHGVPPLAKDFFPSDGELTDESVTGFVGKYGALWGASADAATTTAPEQQAAARISEASATATPRQPAPGDFANYEAQLGEAKTRDDVMALMARIAAAQA